MERASFKYMKCHYQRASRSEFLDGNVFGRVGSSSSIKDVAVSKSLKGGISEEEVSGGGTSGSSSNHQSWESRLCEGSWHEVLDAEGEAVKAQVSEETLGGSENHEPGADGLSGSKLVLGLSQWTNGHIFSFIKTIINLTIFESGLKL